MPLAAAGTLDSGVGGARVVVADAWVRMPDAVQAAALQEPAR